MPPFAPAIREENTSAANQSSKPVVSRFAPAKNGGQPRRLAVMTSGGDSAGMNAAVRSVVKMAIFRGCEAFVIREGWEGLVRGNHTPDSTPSATPSVSRNASTFFDTLDTKGKATHLDQHAVQGDFVPTYGEGELLREGVGEAQELGLRGRYIIRVGWDDVRGWMDQGGTLIGTARSTTFRTPEGREQAAYNLIINGIDALAVCGGDGSLTGADKLRAEWPDLVASLQAKCRITEDQATKFAHLNIVGLVGSIDNDMATTDITIGASTALQRICEAVDSISSTAASHSRAFVVEVMGRHCGWLALMAGIATGADYVFIPERPPQGQEWHSEMCEVLQKHRDLGKRKSIVIVAEGAIDRELNDITPDMIKNVLSNDLGLDTRVTTLGHTQRGGKPDANDRILATLQGIEAVDAVLEATPETPSYVIGISENKITRIPLMFAVEQTQRVAKLIESKDFDGALALRDPEFAEGLRAFKYISQITEDERLPEKKRVRMGIIHVGAPAGGMNAATRTAVRYCLAKGHDAVVIYNGFPGLLEDNISVLNWLRVDNWATRGGSELGVNRHLPDIDIGAVAAKLQEHKIEGLLIVGGFEAFSSVKILNDNRDRYPAFRIPVVGLPATISNNVPMNEFSLGSDTSLNALVDACDAVKQSASASRNRVFVVETQGGKCGYIAVMGALAAGAVLVYTPEAGIGLHQLGKDVAFLKKRFLLDVKGKSEGRLVIRNEKSSDVFTTEVITKILKEEGDTLFDARSASLGHTLQGGVPSPLDRVRATRLALKCCEFLESEALKQRSNHSSHASSSSSKLSASEKSYSDETAVMITIQGSTICFTSATEMAKNADMKNRRGKEAWWHELKALVELLGGRTALAEL
ncbi:probable 6-phosphofructokinase [Melanopsichium pennsylvanicum]|uniref:ATP-dependent 6-phosphofructokinase n=2 Tax=Melanopsichium pennsylvanicum TaxID=63383 RepID=A0AAJ5C8X7_9BASI|nr:probable 6-phosphofructokinase [Melanopsichium pennsylvanicum 4]SNX88154.1 probable 6-phosphofructokinase [Melanopsichium pennsylvanicum]